MAGLQAFMAAMWFKESSDSYFAQNGSFYGAYQFGDLAFRDTGYRRHRKVCSLNSV